MTPAGRPSAVSLLIFTLSSFQMGRIGHGPEATKFHELLHRRLRINPSHAMGRGSAFWFLPRIAILHFPGDITQ